MPGDEELLTFQRFMLAFDTPAYLRRARGVEAEWTHLLSLCARERERRLELPKLRLAQLVVATAALADPLRLPIAEPTRCQWLSLYREWQPQLRSPVAKADAAQASMLVARTTLAFQSFNVAWDRWLREIDLGPVNRLREGYNRYYVLEKECAIRSELSAREGFEELPPACVGDLLRAFPLLPLPPAVAATR